MRELLDRHARDQLIELARTMVDQERARIVVPPYDNSEGFWFGAGNLSRDGSGAFTLVGRYRNAGDSRTGLSAGVRGLELAVFRSVDGAKTFDKVLSLSKRDLTFDDREVVSIEGAKLLFSDSGVELFVSTEKTGIPYPAHLAAFLKPGTGVWTIDHAAAPSVERLRGAKLQTIVASTDPRWLHVKDPVLYPARNGDTVMFFCTHPFNWTSSNTGMTVRRRGAASFGPPEFERFPRGFTWDVAMSRITGLCPVPRTGLLASEPEIALAFYDGGESMRRCEEHAASVRRPRGYSCEEIGGLAFLRGGIEGPIERLSVDLPLFVSPRGTGCSRYVDVLPTEQGYHVTWQQSQADGSQPLVMSFVSRQEIERILR